MDFYTLLDQVADLLQSRSRVSYRALKRQFGLDDDYLEDLKAELIKSQRLAERVGPRVGLNPDVVTGRLSVSVLPTLSTVNVSPLYAIRGKDRSAAKAIQLTDIAVDEARKLYTELNSNEFQSADAQLKTARDALTAFQVANHLPDLASLLQQEGVVIDGLYKLPSLERVADQFSFSG